MTTTMIKTSVPEKRHGCLCQDNILSIWPRLFDTEDATWLNNSINCVVTDDFVNNKEGSVFFGSSASNFSYMSDTQASLTTASTLTIDQNSCMRISSTSNLKPGTRIRVVITCSWLRFMAVIILRFVGCIMEMLLGTLNRTYIYLHIHNDPTIFLVIRPQSFK